MALTTDILAYWKFDSDATDSVGSADGTVSGATNTTGFINNGYDFDGVNDYIDLGDNSALELVNDLTVSFWTKTTTTVNDYFFANGTDFAASQFGGYAIKIQGGKVKVQKATSTTTNIELTGTVSVNDGNWHHVVVLIKSSGNMQIYVDGSSDVSNSDTSDVAYNNHYQQWGAWFSTGEADHAKQAIDALIDECGLWSRELSASEITELYNSGTGVQYPFGAAAVTNDALFFGVGF